MSTMSQLGEFIATIQNNQDVRTAALEERLAQLESKAECGCAETITALEERLASLEAKEECGCAETISTLEERLATLEAKEECGCVETITALEERLATLEAKEECGCGSYDELLASYEQCISALEGNAGGGNTEMMTTSEALEQYPFVISGYKTSSVWIKLISNKPLDAWFLYVSTSGSTTGPSVQSLKKGSNDDYSIYNDIATDGVVSEYVYNDEFQPVSLSLDGTIPPYRLSLNMYVDLCYIAIHDKDNNDTAYFTKTLLNEWSSGVPDDIKATLDDAIANANA